MASYTVTAPLVIAKNEQGQDVYAYRGAPVPEGQSKEWIKTHLDGKMIATVKDAPTPPPPPAPPADEKPAGNASTEEWQAYAVAHGMTEEEAASLSRDEIRERFAD